MRAFFTGATRVLMCPRGCPFGQPEGSRFLRLNQTASIGILLFDLVLSTSKRLEKG